MKVRSTVPPGLLQDIGERYPSWLEEHREGLPEEDFQRYTQQYEYIQKICALYESNPGDYTQLVGLLQQVRPRPAGRSRPETAMQA